MVAVINKLRLHINEAQSMQQQARIAVKQSKEDTYNKVLVEYINYILLKVVAALQMKSVILPAPASASRLATPAAIKDKLLLFLLLITWCVVGREYTLVAGVAAYQYLV